LKDKDEGGTKVSNHKEHIDQKVGARSIPQLEETEIKLFNRKERKVRKTNRICTGEFQTRPLRFVTFVPPR